MRQTAQVPEMVVARRGQGQMVTAVRQFQRAVWRSGMVLLTMIAASLPAVAETQDPAPLACWFYKYKWVYFRMVPNVWPPTTFTTSGIGTGLMVTAGLPPSTAETDAIVNDIQQHLPRGDAEAPPPRASLQSMSRIACPKSLNGTSLEVAKIWLHQPEPQGGANGKKAMR